MEGHLSESESRHEKASVSERLHRIVIHAVEAVRCHLVLLEGKLEAWGRKAVRRVAVILVFALCLLFGVAYILSGLAQLVQDVLPESVPRGVGHLCVGLVVLCGGFTLMALSSKKDQGG